MQNDCQPSQSDRSSASQRKALVAALVYLIASGIGIYGALSFLGSALENIVPPVFNDLLLGSLVVMVSGSAFLMSIFGTCDYITERHRRQILRAEVGEK
jgi:hypothetical protein